MPPRRATLKGFVSLSRMLCVISHGNPHYHEYHEDSKRPPATPSVVGGPGLGGHRRAVVERAYRGNRVDCEPSLVRQLLD